MEITNEVKQRIVAAIAADRENYPSDNRHATALGIAPSVYNAIKRQRNRKEYQYNPPLKAHQIFRFHSHHTSLCFLKHATTAI